MAHIIFQFSSMNRPVYRNPTYAYKTGHGCGKQQRKLSKKTISVNAARLDSEDQIVENYADVFD